MNECNNCIQNFVNCNGINQTFGGLCNDEVLYCDNQIKFKGLKSLVILYSYKKLLLNETMIEEDEIEIAILELEKLNNYNKEQK